MVLFEFSNLADTGFYLEALGIRQAHLTLFHALKSTSQEHQCKRCFLSVFAPSISYKGAKVLS